MVNLDFLHNGHFVPIGYCPSFHGNLIPGISGNAGDFLGNRFRFGRKRGSCRDPAGFKKKIERIKNNFLRHSKSSLPLACFILPPPAGGGKSFPEALAEEKDEIYLIALINKSSAGRR